MRREVRGAAALRRLEAPHRQPGPQRAGAADGEGPEVGAAWIAGVAAGDAVGRVEREVGEAEVGPHAVQVEDAVPRAAPAWRRSSSDRTHAVMRSLRATCAARYRSTNSGAYGGPWAGSNMSRSGSTDSGSVSSVTAGSIQAVSTSGRPGCAFTET